MYPKSSSVSVEKFGSVPDALPVQSCSSQVQRINEGACGKPPAPICNSICCLIRVDSNTPIFWFIICVSIGYKIRNSIHIRSGSTLTGRLTMKGQTIGYARVSSVDQNLARQLEQLKTEHPDRIFEDKASGATTNRPAFQQMMEYVREGDTIIVCSMDRLARNLADLLNITKELQDKGVSIRFLKESIKLDATGSDAAMTKLLMSMLGAVAEFERAMIRERQREGIELAKKRGVYKGRKPTDIKIIEKAKEKIALGVPLAKAARDAGIARSTLYRQLQKLS